MPETDEKINSEGTVPDRLAVVGKLTLGEVQARLRHGASPEQVAGECGITRNTLRDRLAALDVAWQTETKFERDLVVKSTGKVLA